MNDREFSHIEIFQHSRKGIPLFMAGHKNYLQADYSYLLGPGSPHIKKDFTGPRSHKGWETLRYGTLYHVGDWGLLLIWELTLKYLKE
jgi:hypothetical protein